jgi:hypothetical protein
MPLNPLPLTTKHMLGVHVFVVCLPEILPCRVSLTLPDLLQAVLEAENDRDPYAHMSKSGRAAWRGPPHRNISELKAGFSAVPAPVLVQVRVRGCEGDGWLNLLTSSTT